MEDRQKSDYLLLKMKNPCVTISRKSGVWTAMKQTHAAMEMKPVSCLPLSVTTWSCLISTCPAQTE